MATIGYARVSTPEQSANMQLQALEEAGAESVFVDTGSGATQARPQLLECLRYLRAGDVLCVWRLDRLGRSLGHLIEIVEDLQQRDVDFRSLTEGFDTTSPGGRLVFHVFGAVAEFERSLIQERTRAGLEAARKQGRTGWRPTVMTPDRIRVAREMRARGDTIRAIAAALGVGRSTVARHLGRQPDGDALWSEAHEDR